MISILFLLPAVQPSASSDALQLITEEEARQFIDGYVARYIELQIDPFMALFSKQAIENRMLPYGDIHELYRKTFVNSNSVNYRLKIYTVQCDSHCASVRGRYELVQSVKNKIRPRTFGGDILWKLVREDGELRIEAMNYGRSR
jgi:hypothetical protein